MSDENIEPTEMQVWNAEQMETVPGMREAFMKLVDAIPEPGDDAILQIMQQVIQATSVEQLDAPWQAEGMREWDGVAIRVTGIQRMPSDFKSGLGIYLVVHCVELGSGEAFVLTTGSLNIVIQLMKAHVLDAFPLDVVPKQSERPSKSGYFPMHLELVRRRAARRPAVVPVEPAAAAEGAPAGARRAR